MQYLKILFQTLIKFSPGEAILNSISSVGGYGRSSRFVGRSGVTTLIVKRRRKRFVITRLWSDRLSDSNAEIVIRIHSMGGHVSNGSGTRHVFQTGTVLSDMP